ncbi:hypothetical protein CK203_052356 [Vitis vinifera]|uniref:TIR domain-containing protein n=1 Tax=Vitis vinifera TaxID=29760 RepID=A0A438H341_VITVI|nr:hypothetical protein CK203_052356 [Vitis vinifera]
MEFTPSEMMKKLRKDRTSNRIIEYTTLEDNKVIPVFYHVKPLDVGHQSGRFKVAFFNHEKNADEKWRIALKKAAQLVDN